MISPLKIYCAAPFGRAAPRSPPTLAAAIAFIFCGSIEGHSSWQDSQPKTEPAQLLSTSLPLIKQELMLRMHEKKIWRHRMSRVIQMENTRNRKGVKAS